MLFSLRKTKQHTVTISKNIFVVFLHAEFHYDMTLNLKCELLFIFWNPCQVIHQIVEEHLSKGDKRRISWMHHTHE